MSGKRSIEILDTQPVRVLVCDDSTISCRLVQAVLEREGYKVVVVYNGEDCLEEVRRRPFDLVLLDIELPGVSGIEVTRQLRSRQSDRVYLPIILLTGNTEKEARTEGLRAGATDFLTKPFEPAELAARIHNHVAAKRLHDRLVGINKALEDEQAKVFKVQQALLPQQLPRREGLRFGAQYRPFSMAGGDFYDVMERHDGRLLLAAADISGHGIPSAMHMSTVRAVLHSEVSNGSSIEQIVVRLNHILSFGLDDFSFVTFYLGEYDPVTHQLRQVVAGHHEPLLHDLATDEIRELAIVPACPLGIDPDIAVAVTEHQLAPGQRLLIYTDGIIEQGNTEGKFYGLAGLKDCMQRHARTHVEFLPTFIMDELAEFHNGVPQSDDLTILCMEVTRPTGHG
jgi:sigma-B regulation protein RsbU (phosphoserine phosphatase)